MPKPKLYYIKKPKNKYTHIFKTHSDWSLCWQSHRFNNDNLNKKLLPTGIKGELCPNCQKRLMTSKFSKYEMLQESDVILGLVVL